MPDETISTETVKTVSDGIVKISVEKYNELLEKVASQKDSIGNLNRLLNEARNEPPVINRTTVIKTAEVLANEHRAWGVSFMGLGAGMFVVGVLRFRASRTES
jgi:hypothetical protein